MDIYAVPVGHEDRMAVAQILENSLEGLGDWFLDLEEEFQEDLIAAIAIYQNRAESVDRES